MVDYATLYYTGHLLLLFAASVLVGKLAGPIVTRVLEGLSSKTSSTLDDRIIAATKTPIETFFFLIVFYLLLHSSPDLSEAAAVLEKYTLVILIVIATFTLSEASGAAIRWYYEEGQEKSRIGQRVQKLGVDNSLLPLVRKLTKLGIYVIGFTFAIYETGFDITGLLAVTSVTALILGLASQETLANIFAGIALQMDRPYHYGDYLRLLNGEIAIVRKIGMRSTKLQDLNHNTIIISNSEFAKMRVTNLTLPDDESIVQVPAELPLGADLEKLKARIIAALARAKPNGLLAERGYALTIDAIKPSSVAVSFSFWVKHYVNTSAIREIINREILEFAKGRK